jgi:iron(III) transport system permease protein
LGSGEYVKVIYGTVSVLVLAIIIKEMPLGTQIIKAGVLQISNELEEASSAAGATWLAGFRRILLPLLKPTMLAVGVIVFISAARDIPTVIFLATKSKSNALTTDAGLHRRRQQGESGGARRLFSISHLRAVVDWKIVGISPVIRALMTKLSG